MSYRWNNSGWPDGLGRSRPRSVISTDSKKYRILAKHNWSCFYCGKSLLIDTATLDHVIPKSKGGSNDESNLVPACKDCNKLKGSQYPYPI